jgi:hypothetical protein
MFGMGGIVAGLILILIGGALVFVFPGPREYQPTTFTMTGIVTGFVMIILGAILIFV